MIGGIFQIIIALALVIILCVVAFMVYNMEMVKAIRESGRIKRKVVIFQGVKDLAVSKDEAYNTVNPADPMYRNIENSVNQKAGAEYTYNFWLYLGPSANTALGSPANSVSKSDEGLLKVSDNANNKPLVLMLRGSKQAVPYKGLCNQTKLDVMVKQPLIKLERGGDVLSVELNTNANPDGVKEKSRDTCNDFNTNWESVNSYRVAVKGLTTRTEFQGKWNMVTLIVQDTFPTDPLPIRNKVRVRLYVNGLLELDRYIDGSMADTSGSATLLRNNSGNLFFAPIIKGYTTASANASTTNLSKELTSTKTVMMADLSYFNYAVDSTEMNAMFSEGFTKSYAPSMTANPLSNDTEIMNNKAFATADPILAEVGKTFA